jgi:hypothetical protein
MNPRSVFGHVRRYPRWYGVAVIWAVAMVALPVVELDPLNAFSGSRDAATVDAGDTAAEDGTALPPITSGTVPSGGIVSPVDTSGDTTSTTEPGATTTTLPTELELVPEELLDAIFDLLPPPVIPPLPPELAKLAAAIAPIATTGCSGLGLASVIVAVVAQSAEGVPVGRLLPYLAPVSSACASFPIPKVHTVCAADEPLILDLAGLTSSPPIIGLGIDQLDAIESQLATTFGQSVPRLAPSLREQFDCELVS